MGIFRSSREPRGPDPHLDLKILLFFLAAAMGLGGMWLEEPWLIFAAILMLVLGVLLRFLPRKEEEGGDGPSEVPGRGEPGEDPAGERSRREEE